MSLSLLLPNGSMHDPTLALFSQAFLPVERVNGQRGYDAKINDPRIKKVKFLRPQDMPELIANGNFDMAITGKDLIREACLRLASEGKNIKERISVVCDLKLTKSDVGTVRLVLCGTKDSPIQSAKELPEGAVIYTEFPHITREWLAGQKIQADVRRCHGSTEAFIPDVCDLIVELVETGATLARNGLKIIETIMTTTACLIVNPSVYQHHREDIEDLKILLESAPFAGVQGIKFVGGENAKFLLKFHLPLAQKKEAFNILPPNRFPTMIPIAGHPELLAVEVVVSGQSSWGTKGIEEGANVLIPKLKRLGASEILAMPLSIMAK